MNLLQLRTKFVELSGNYKLVTDRESFQDNGADFHIQNGQRFVEDLLDLPRTAVSIVKEYEAEQEQVALPRARYLRSVFFEDSEEDWNRLRQIPYREFQQKEKSGRQYIGTPCYWSTPDALEVEYEDPNTLETEQDLGITVYLLPLPNKAGKLRLEGSFRSIKLEEDIDSNFWSRQYPGLLIQAAMYDVEKFYRNRQGMEDHLTAIQRQLRGIDDNIAQQAAEESQQMSSSW